MIKRMIITLVIMVSFLSGFEIGALDSQYWNGIILNDSGDIYGFRFAIEKESKIADGYDTFYIVEEPGIISPDYSYAEISFNTELPFGLKSKTSILEKNIDKKGILKLVYGKYGKGVIGYLIIPDNVKIILKFYSPWNRGKKVVFNKGRFVSSDSKFKFYRIGDKLYFNGADKEHSPVINGNSFYFYAGFENFDKDKTWIKNRLEKEKERYEKNRVKFTGEFKGVFRSITQNLYWMKLLQPDKKRIYIPAGRRWIFPGKTRKYDLWTMFEWDSFFNAIELAAEDMNLAKQEVEAVLDTQYGWGNIPNWRSATAGSTDRAQPPVGAFTVLKIFYKTGDLNFLKKSYKRLVKFHKYWTENNGKHLKRDGNNNFLFEWGSDTELINKILPSWEIGATGRVRAAWESGQDDLPNYDDVKFNEKTNSIELDCIDLSSLVALDACSLSEIAKELGYLKDSKYFKDEYKKISKRINKYLWNDEKGFYFDRYWDGRFSNKKASSNFYPLLAGVVPENRVQKIMDHLLNKKEFWGEYIIPTISRDDKAFENQQYWRGTIWPPTNYLVYQGIKRYGFDEIAAEFARKSVKLFLRSWEKYRLCRENYNSITGEGGGQRYQSWGPLFALVLIEEFIDYSPFTGLTVGNLAASKKTSIKNYKIGKHIFDIFASGNSFKLYKDSVERLSFKGRAVLRNLMLNENEIRFGLSVYSDGFEILPMFKRYDLIVNGKKVGKKYKFKRGKYRIIFERRFK